MPPLKAQMNSGYLYFRWMYLLYTYYKNGAWKKHLPAIAMFTFLLYSFLIGLSLNLVMQQLIRTPDDTEITEPGTNHGF